jgi:phosphoglycolate phosphatase-like HAD superfamily hydrolase
VSGHVEAVFFDVGETIVDETVFWTWWADHFGIPRFTFFAVFGALIERAEDHRRIFDIFGVERDGSWPGFGIDDLYPDALPCLRELKQSGLRLGLVGNTSEQIEDILRTLDLPVDVIGSSERWRVEKPSPAFFERVVTEAGAPASRVAYVGDRLDNDVLPAVDAGMIGVFLRRGPWGWLHAASPDASRATLRIDSLAELPGALR